MFGDAKSAFDGTSDQPLPDSKQSFAYPQVLMPSQTPPQRVTPRQDICYVLYRVLEGRCAVHLSCEVC